MKKQHILIAIILVSSFPFVSYGAETETTSFSITSWIKGIKDAIVLKLEDNKDEMRRYHEEKRREAKETLAKLNDTKKETIEESLTNSMKLRTEDTLKKFESIAERLESRKEKLQKLGADISDAEKKITEAQELRKDAVTQYDLLIWNTDDEVIVAQNMDIINSIQKDIALIHKDFSEAIELLKQAQEKLNTKSK